MALVEHYVTATGTDTYANATNIATPCSFATAVAGETAGDRVNVKFGTYASTTTTRTLAAVGTTTAPIWWRGYNTTPGDIDTDQTLAKPSLTFTTGRLSVTGAHHILSNFDISGAFATGQQLNVTGVFSRFYRCRIENTSAAAASRAVTNATNGISFHACWFKATSTSTSVVNITASTQFRDCVFVGGGHGLDQTTGTAFQVVGCFFLSNPGDGINISSAPTNFLIDRCTFYGATSDGIELAALPSQTGTISNCIFSNNGGYGINNSTGANTNTVLRCNNDFYLNTSNPENGFGDSPSFAQQSESGSPFTNAAGGDFSLLSTAAAKATGSPVPGTFENQSYTSYLDIGAAQRQEAGGGPVGQQCT